MLFFCVLLAWDKFGLIQCLGHFLCSFLFPYARVGMSLVLFSTWDIFSAASFFTTLVSVGRVWSYTVLGTLPLLLLFLYLGWWGTILVFSSIRGIFCTASFFAALVSVGRVLSYLVFDNIWDVSSIASLLCALVYMWRVWSRIIVRKFSLWRPFPVHYWVFWRESPERESCTQSQSLELHRGYKWIRKKQNESFSLFSTHSGDSATYRFAHPPLPPLHTVTPPPSPPLLCLLLLPIPSISATPLHKHLSSTPPSLT